MRSACLEASPSFRSRRSGLSTFFRRPRQAVDNAMTDDLNKARYQLALANRIIAHEGVLDAFGHVSIRHPTNPDRFLISRSRSPELVEPLDILEFHLDSSPVSTPQTELYGERVI